MTYPEALEYIHNTLQYGSKPGLERIAFLLEKMGNPQDSLRFIHVAGTNGKGSICTACASVLVAAGYKTGLFISPYITDFRERIQINGQMISEDDLAAEVERIRPFAEETAKELEQPTEFEIIAALAFQYFKARRCDAVVLEVGLGGRFDATNVIKAPLVSVIASVSLDHTEILGDTIAKIAFEKCGIIKAGGATVTVPGQDTQALKMIQKACARMDNQLIIPESRAVSVLQEGIEGSRITYKGHEYVIPLGGRQQIGNFITAAEAAGVLNSRGFSIGCQDIANGFAKVSFPARLEILSRRPLIILDGAHNPGAAQALAASIDRYLPGKKIIAVMGILKDKAYETVIPLVASRCASFIAVEPENPRALPSQETAKVAARSCTDCVWREDLAEAFEEALRRANAESVILICGSFYLAGPMRCIVLKKLE